MLWKNVHTYETRGVNFEIKQCKQNVSLYRLVLTGVKLWNKRNTNLQYAFI